MNWRGKEYCRGSADFSFSTSSITRDRVDNPLLDSLDYWTLQRGGDFPDLPENPDLQFISDLTRKILFRGTRTFLQPEIEQLLLKDLPESHQPGQNKDINGSSGMIIPNILKEAYSGLKSLGHPVPFPDLGKSNPLDPDNPQNEGRLLQQLYEMAGPEIGSYLYPQCPLDMLLPPDQAKSFFSQRLDFLLWLPNGKGLVLEPGDHEEAEEARDKLRETVCRRGLGMETIRIRNDEIGTKALGETLTKAIADLGAEDFLNQPNPIERTLITPSAILRMEACFSDALLRRNLLEKKELVVEVIERDVCVAELSLLSFLTRQQNLARLYGIALPEIYLQLRIKRSVDKVPSSVNSAKELLKNRFGIVISTELEEAGSPPADLSIDLSISSGYLLLPEEDYHAVACYAIRNSFPHHDSVSLRCQSEPRAVSPENATAENLNPFLQEFFRKEALYPDQVRILQSILQRRDTIGLLPTGAGKSICYQMAGLLGTGTTIVVDPIVALMDDQAAALKTRFRISRVQALHHGVERMDNSQLASLLEHNIFIFLSPERFLRRPFRDALRSAVQAGFYIGLAAVDEAHCVSMWGHDFRPAYLELARNIRKYANSLYGPPPILGLTGTASQLVLIDLVRQLGINLTESVVRPNTFERKELNYRVVSCRPEGKFDALTSALRELNDRLKVQSVLDEEYGIIFSITPRDILKNFVDLFGEEVENELLNFNPTQGFKNNVQYGIYCGKCPVSSNENQAALAKNWDAYKRTVFDYFTKGKIRCIVANNALSVGIDHEAIRYVINLQMPSSLEGYYQQAGRAGRNGQTSYCFLLFSDDNPTETDNWIRGNGHSARFSGDLSTIQYFHRSNFPGVKNDLDTLAGLIRVLLSELQAKGERTIRLSRGEIEKIPVQSAANKPVMDKLGRFIGYLSILGLIEDYEVEGMAQGTVYVLGLNRTFYDAVFSKDAETGGNHVMTSLLSYLNRYQPISEEDLFEEVQSLANANYSGKVLLASADFLMAFLYDRIAYQRLKSIDTMLRFCRESSQQPDRARQVIRNYFDRSRFTEDLESLRKKKTDFAFACGILEKLEDFEDAEQLFWETRRLLDEAPRSDWSFISAVCDLFSNRATLETFSKEILNLIKDEDETAVLKAACEAIRIIQDKCKLVTLKAFSLSVVEALYTTEDFRHISLEFVEFSELDPEFQALASTVLLNLQLKRLLHVTR